MSPALIVAAVVAFLAIDAVIVYLVFRSRARADDYGKFPVPGQTSLVLSPGRLRVSYQESYTAGGGEDTIDFGVPAALEVTVTAPTGEAMDIKAPGFGGMGESLNTGRGWSRALIGTVQIAQTGEYTVTAEGDLPDAIEPQILVGK